LTIFKYNRNTKTQLHAMPPTPQAILFVFNELWGQQQLEDFICGALFGGFDPAMLQAVLSLPPHNETPYKENLVAAAVRLVLAGHQRTPSHILQEMGYLQMLAPLPALEVTNFYRISLCPVH
jgi:hypothetical protein